MYSFVFCQLTNLRAPIRGSRSLGVVGLDPRTYSTILTPRPPVSLKEKYNWEDNYDCRIVLFSFIQVFQEFDSLDQFLDSESLKRYSSRLPVLPIFPVAYEIYYCKQSLVQLLTERKYFVENEETKLSKFFPILIIVSISHSVIRLLNFDKLWNLHKGNCFISRHFWWKKKKKNCENNRTQQTCFLDWELLQPLKSGDDIPSQHQLVLSCPLRSVVIQHCL